MGYERLKQIKHNLMCAIESQMCNLQEADAEELGCAIDMLKDVEEAIYFSTITEAMEGKGKYGGDLNVEIEKERQHSKGQDKMYNRMYSMRYMPQQDRSYAMYYPESDQMYDMMYREGEPVMYNDSMYRMYADNQGGHRIGRPSGSQNQNDSSRSYTTNNGNSNSSQGESSSSNYSEPMMHERDYREGRSPQSRKMYLEAKEQKHDKASQLRELEKYMQELSSDIVEMIQEASPEEKQYLEKKISALASKIGQMK